MMTNEHTSLEKYTSHALFKMAAKGLCVSGELETEQTATYWPPVPLSLAALLSRSAGLLNRGSWGPIARCCVLVLSTASYLQLTNLSVAPGYIIVWHPPASCGRHICTQFNPSTVKVIPWYLRPDAPVPWLTAGSKVNMLHWSNRYIKKTMSIWKEYVTLYNCVQTNDCFWTELLIFDWNSWYQISVCKLFY